MLQWLKSMRFCQRSFTSCLERIGDLPKATQLGKDGAGIKPVHVGMLSHVWLFATPQTVACWAPLSMGFSRQEYWSGLPFPSPGHLLNPGITPTSFASPALAGRCFTSWAIGLCNIWGLYDWSLSNSLAKGFSEVLETKELMEWHYH